MLTDVINNRISGLDRQSEMTDDAPFTGNFRTIGHIADQLFNSTPQQNERSQTTLERHYLCCQKLYLRYSQQYRTFDQLFC